MTAIAPARPLRTGIVGAGLISDIHIRGVQRLGKGEVVGIVDTELRRAQSKAQQHGVPGAFATLGDLLRAAVPDVVHILTPPATHAELCVEALEAGAHVYVEKPMASTEADCDRMTDAARRAGRQLCVGHSLVYDPMMRRVLEMLEAGEVGEVIHASAVYTFDPARIPGYRGKGWYRQLGGGFVEDLASHPASVLLRVIGAPLSVTGAADKQPEREGNEMAALIHAERGTGSLLISLGARPEEVSLDVRCTRGTIRLNFSTMVLAVQRERGIPKKLAHGFKNLEMATQLAVQTVTSTARFLTGRLDATKGIHTLIEEFYRTLGAGEAAPVSGEEGRHVVRLLRALWPEASPEASKPKRWVLSRPDGEPQHPDGELGPAAERGASTGGALVTGATGFIGTHLVRALAERGVRVRALARDPRRGAHLAGPDVEVVIGDAADPEVIHGLAEGVEVVYHLASVMKGSWEEFERLDVEGSRLLLEEAKRAGVRRIVYTSTMAAYPLGDLRDGTVVTEESVPADSSDRVSPYARAKLAVEELLLEANRKGEIEAVVTRPGLVFGPGASPFLTHLPHLGKLQGDRYVMFGDGRVPLPLTYVENTVDALLRCATAPDAPGNVFTIVDDAVPTQREYVRRLAELTGRPLRVTAVPRAAVYMLGLGVEAAAGVMRKKPPTTRRLLLGKTVKLRFDCARAKRVLEWTPEVSWEEGLRRAVEAEKVGEATLAKRERV